MVRRIEVVPHNPKWIEMFKREAENLNLIFSKEIISIYHIGSTAIPQIKAKPIVDILIEVNDIDKIDNYNPKMIECGYIPKGELGIPKRRYFSKRSEEHRSFHVHIFGKENPEIKRHLNFRDFMIAHPNDAQAYSHLKTDLARKYPEDIDAYCDGKDEFIKNIDERAKKWR
ncbi:MAG: GrpB family protein [Promethearchaeota archaeon]|jgi:GrpB-like predicted nucleotidyltransferase (UPF0157 family)